MPKQAQERKTRRARQAHRKGRAAIWLRYNWWKPALHMLLIVFGLVNLYPFVWMLGTSFKAEAEASTERLLPTPKMKYKLAADFELRKILPDAMEPALPKVRRELETLTGARRKDLEALSGERREGRRRSVEDKRKQYTRLLGRLKKKLELVDKMQRDAWPDSLIHFVSATLGKIGDPEVVSLLTEIEGSKEQVGRLGKELKGATSDKARLKKALARAHDGLDEKQKKLNALLKQRIGALVDDGFLEKAGQGYWLTEKGCGPGAGNDSPTPREQLLQALRGYFSMTPKAFSSLSRSGLEDSEAMLNALAAVGVLRALPKDSPDRETAFCLVKGARERVTADALYPRQVLTLWAMRDENIRRSESRQTYAKDRRAVSDYADAFVKDEEKAKRELEELAEKGYLVNGRFQPVNYWVVLKEENFLLHFMTSMLITAVVVFGTVLISSMLGYALARVRFPGKMVVLGVMITASVLPGEARIIPIFKMLLAVGAMDNLWGMVVWLTSFGVGNALLMAGFFLTLPKEMDEAAAVDGAGVFRKFFDIALPMARPIVMTVGLFAFLSAWNNFLIPLLCTISRPSMQPLAVAVYNFQQGHPGKWHQINAAAAIMIVPVILMFMFVQKHVVKAIAVGAVKG